MKEPESPIMAKILIRFNFETEIYVRYRSEEIAPPVGARIKLTQKATKILNILSLRLVKDQKLVADQK